VTNREEGEHADRDELQEWVESGAANVVRRRYESGEYTREEQREKRLSYTPTKGWLPTKGEWFPTGTGWVDFLHPALEEIVRDLTNYASTKK